jgi:RHS repeat-associated protein
VYNAENRLATVQQLSQGPCPAADTLATANIAATWNFIYNGDGNRVQQEYFEGVFGQDITVKVTSYFAGGSYELDQSGLVQADSTILVSATTTRKYYSFAGQTIAMGTTDTGIPGTVTLDYFLTDQLGSVVAVTDSSGALLSQQRYLPFGQVRTDMGSATQTDLGFTGQRNLDAQGNTTLGLMDYKARMYDPSLARFVQPDTVIPASQGPQGLNRYSYTTNNPVNSIDPTGHRNCDEDGYGCSGPLPDPGEASLNSGSAGSVVVGQSQPVDSMDVSKYAEETWDKTSYTQAPYGQPNSFGEMNGGDAAIYGLNWFQVFEDQLSLWAPQHPSNNVFLLVDWGHTGDTLYVPQMHLVNFTYSSARIWQVQLKPVPNPGHKVTVYGESSWLGRNGENPGALNYSLSNQGYKTGVSVSVWVKVASVAMPMLSQITIPANGLQPGLSDPIPWITGP